MKDIQKNLVLAVLTVLLLSTIICLAGCTSDTRPPYRIGMGTHVWLDLLLICLIIAWAVAVALYLLLWFAMVLDAHRYGHLAWLLVIVFVLFGAVAYYCIVYERSFKKKRTAIILAALVAGLSILVKMLVYF